MATDTPSSVRIGDLALGHRVINGSGTFDALTAHQAFGPAAWEEFPFAAFVSKTITPEARIGNPPPRLFETPSGMINSIGLPNKGLDGFVEADLPRLAELPVPLVVSVMATDQDGFAAMIEALENSPAIAAYELNISCPNVHSGLIVGENPSEASALITRLRPLTRRPLIVKLTPNTAGPDDVARAAEEAGADAVSLINTLKAMAINPASGRPWLGARTGGLSGPAIRPVALAQVAAVSAAVSVPVIGMGGIETGAHAREFLDAGASVVAVGTANFRDPASGSRIRQELEEFAAKTEPVA